MKSVEERLDAALQVFWERGYESASIAELSRALGVSASSLYNDFGDKAGLYGRCLERYARERGAFLSRALAHPECVEALCALLEAAVAEYTGGSCPGGCAVLDAPRARCEGSASVDALVVGMREATLEAIRARVARGLEEGDLDASLDASAVARHVFALIAGLSSQARDGAGRGELEAAARLALPSLRALAAPR